MNGMNEMQLYSRWVAQNLEDTDLAEELAAVAGDTDAIKDRFFRDLEFGTGGLRGVIGAGTNRMNIYTVRKATQGPADYLKATYPNPSVAVSYDSRIKSDLFARETASVLAANGIKVYLYPELNPTPALSFAVRDLHCQAGVMITASHNPAKYNGYKAYGPDGCQMTIEAANAVLDCINRLDIFDDIRTVDFEAALADGWIAYIGQDTYARFLENVRAQSIHPEALRQTDLKVVYTPLNGTGNKPVREILRMTGVKNVVVVKEQELPDGEFPTVSYPNPEAAEAFELGLKLAREVDADLVLATDPDADRLGVYVKDSKSGEYKVLTGNMSGCLLADYEIGQIKQHDGLPDDGALIKTIVTSNMADAIASYYGVRLIEVLTGFKYIGQQILGFETSGKGTYLFGFEESYGCLIGTHARDKDAIVATMALCEAAAYYKTKNMTLWDAMIALYERYGYYKDDIQSITLKGMEGVQKIQEILDTLRKNPPKRIGGYDVVRVRDYKKDEIKNMSTGEVTPTGLPNSNVLYYDLTDDAWLCVRPSGTEPKVKFYYGIKGSSLEDADEKSAALGKEVLDMIHAML